MAKLKLTDQIIADVKENLELGLRIIDCCHLAGISEPTYYNWIKKAEQGDKRYFKFVEAIKESEATAQKKLITDIQVDPSWQSKAWILERRWRDKWGRHDKIEFQEVRMIIDD